MAKTPTPPPPEPVPASSSEAVGPANAKLTPAQVTAIAEKLAARDELENLRTVLRQQKPLEVALMLTGSKRDDLGDAGRAARDAACDELAALLFNLEAELEMMGVDLHPNAGG